MEKYFLKGVIDVKNGIEILNLGGKTGKFLEESMNKNYAPVPLSREIEDQKIHVVKSTDTDQKTYAKEVNGTVIYHTRKLLRNVHGVKEADTATGAHLLLAAALCEFDNVPLAKALLQNEEMTEKIIQGITELYVGSAGAR